MVAFKDLWYGHPVNESVQYPCVAPRDLVNLEQKPIREGFPVFGNQCAIRMTVALKNAGVRPQQLSGCAHCSVHPLDEMHFINASQVANALARGQIPGLGTPQKIIGKDASAFYPKLFGRTGVIYIQDYWLRTTDQPGRPTGDHIDVWNGYRPTTKWIMEWFSWLGYYSNYAEAREIWFWEVK